MTTLYVDGDACPVKDEVIRVAERHGLPVVLVSNRGLRDNGHPLVRSVMVAEGPDAADDWIAAHAGAGDVVVTNDIPLAARCVARQARALAANGRTFDPASIGMAVAVRDLMSHLRETGTVTGGPPAFTRQDRARFLDALERLLQAIRRQG